MLYLLNCFVKQPPSFSLSARRLYNLYCVGGDVKPCTIYLFLTICFLYSKMTQHKSTYLDALKKISHPTSGDAATAKLLLPVSTRTLICAIVQNNTTHSCLYLNYAPYNIHLHVISTTHCLVSELSYNFWSACQIP